MTEKAVEVVDVEIIEETKKPETIDLVLWINNKLKELKHPKPEVWMAGLSLVKETNPGEPLPVIMQIFKVNRALRFYLGSLKDKGGNNVNTMDIRSVIQDIEDVEQWKDAMRKFVLPFMVDNYIPEVRTIQ